MNMVFSLIVYKASPKGTLEGLTAGSFLILRFLIVYKASPKGTLEGLTAGSFLILRGNSFTCFWITTLYGIFRCEGAYCFTSGNQSIPWHA